MTSLNGNVWIFPLLSIFGICYSCYSSHPCSFLVYTCLLAKGWWASEFWFWYTVSYAEMVFCILPVCIMLATCNRVIVFKTTLNDVHVLSIYFLFPASSNFSDILSFFGAFGKKWFNFRISLTLSLSFFSCFIICFMIFSCVVHQNN